MSDAPKPQPQQSHMSARVPDRIGQGVFSTGVLVMTGNTEFVLDFVQNLGQPAQIAARIVMPHQTMPQFIQALTTNLEMYRKRFGDPPELPAPTPNPNKPTLQEIYDDLKISDDTLSGSYANGVMIGHAASEFKFDFLANMMPTPAVSARVYLAAPHVPRLLQSLTKTFSEFQRRVAEQQQRQQQAAQQQQPEQQQAQQNTGSQLPGQQQQEPGQHQSSDQEAGPEKPQDPGANEGDDQ